MATLVGFVLRCWPFGRLGLNQFDEGIYCLAAVDLVGSFRPSAMAPTLIAYAPPGYPILVALMARLVGPIDLAATLVSATTGAGTIGLLGVLTWRLFGPAAGVVTAWSICWAGPHIAFSRMALTDAAFLACWTLGLGASARFLERPGVWTGVLMGLAVGLAQQFKYHGWLLGGFVVIAALIGLVRPAERSWSRWITVLGWGTLGAAIALVVTAPWILFVEGHGGYARLLDHQRSYLDGWRLWPANLVAQANQAIALAGPSANRWACGIAVLLSLRWIEPAPPRSWWSTGLIATTTACLAVAPLAVGPFVALSLIRDPRPGRRLVVVHWISLGLLAPFYHPYARLWLPFEATHWLLLGAFACPGRGQGGLGETGWIRSRPIPQQDWRRLIIVGGVLFFGLGFPLGGRGVTPAPGLYAASDSLATVAREVVRRLPSPAPLVATLVRPSLGVYLAPRAKLVGLEDLEASEKVTDPTAWLLIDSAVLPVAPDRDEPLPLVERSERWSLVSRIPGSNSLPTALDLDPRSRNPATQAVAHFWLFRPRPRTLAP